MAVTGQPRRRHRARTWYDESATAGLMLPIMLWVATLAAIAIVDIGAYLVAAGKAQTLADHAALAAISADVTTSSRASPVAEADRVVQRGGGWLETCDCRSGDEHVSVSVSVPVQGLVIPTLGATRVKADASAILAPAPSQRTLWEPPAGPVTEPGQVAPHP